MKHVLHSNEQQKARWSDFILTVSKKKKETDLNKKGKQILITLQLGAACFSNAAAWDL